MKTKAQAAIHIFNYQERCQKMVAPPGVSRKPKKKRGEKHTCTKPPKNQLTGTLAKRTKRLHERQHGMQHLRNEPGYHVPGSMTK